MTTDIIYGYGIPTQVKSINNFRKIFQRNWPNNRDEMLLVHLNI